MKLQEIEREALALGEGDRAALVCALIRTLPAPTSDLDDEEALRRDQEIESGAVQPLTNDEFVQRVQASRRG